MRELIIFILILFLIGCSSAFRDINYIPDKGLGWEINKNSASYKCENIEYRVGKIGMERLFMTGPIIPLIPFKHEYPGIITITLLKENEGSDITCPALKTSSNSHKVHDSHKSEKWLTCTYKLGRDFITADTVNLSFQTIEECTLPELQFVSKSDWDYCLVCTH